MKEIPKPTSAIQDIWERERAGAFINRNINQYAMVFGMTKEEFLAWLSTKKRVLDLGAGDGLLKKQLDVLKQIGLFTSNTEIFSFDLKYALNEHSERADWSNYLAYQSSKMTPDTNDLEEVGNRFRQTAVAGTWRNLPFADNSFDGVLAAYSFGVVSADKDQLISAFHEVDRVLDKVNGSGFISIPRRVKDNLGALSENGFIPYSLDEISYLKPVLHAVSMPVDDEFFDFRFLEVKR